MFTKLATRAILNTLKNFENTSEINTNCPRAPAITLFITQKKKKASCLSQSAFSNSVILPRYDKTSNKRLGNKMRPLFWNLNLVAAIT